MKVCLIIPPSGFLLDERVFMSLGILHVAGVLEQAGISVELLDLSGKSDFREVARNHIERSEAECFGITATTPQLPSAVAVARVIREAKPKARIILGGPHVTAVNAGVKQGSGRALSNFQAISDIFDVLVAGDGEDAISTAIGPNPPKLVDADDVKSPLFLTPEKRLTLPFPARHLIDVDSYHYEIDGERALSLIAQLGCPFNCGFCCGRSSPSLRRIRKGSPERTVEEMIHLRDTYEVKGFMLYDDELNVNPELVRLLSLISQAQSDRGEAWKLRGFVKSELFTREQAEAMYKAGFRWILIGFESGAPRILDAINKKATVDDNTRCLHIAHGAGLKVKALMSCGHPGESRETLMETRDWLIGCRPDDFDLTVITPYPGSPYFDRAVPTGDGEWVYDTRGHRLYQGDVDYTLVEDYYKGVPGKYRSHVRTEHLSPEKIVGFRDSIEREVREALGLSYPSGSARVFEHSMGQTG